MIQTPPPLTSFKLVGDNIDKNIRPRDMHIDHQGRSLHYFHTYAVRDRVDLSDVSDVPMSPDLSATNLTDLLPTAADHDQPVKNFAILMARVIRNNMPFFSKQHDYSSQMSQKSEVVHSIINSGIQLYILCLSSAGTTWYST